MRRTLVLYNFIEDLLFNIILTNIFNYFLHLPFANL